MTLFLTQNVIAQPNPLYESESIVDNQGDQQRRQAAQKILQQVLLKVVGNRTLLTEEKVAPILKKADSLVSSYAYRYDPSLSQRSLWLRFDEKTFNQALTKARLPIWSVPRPEVLLWLVLTEDNKQIIVGADEPRRESTLIDAVSDKRKLPIFLPLMDLQDQHQLRFAQTAEELHAQNPFVTTAQRYDAPVIALAKVAKQNGVTTVAMQWLFEGKLQQTSAQGELRLALTEAIEVMADSLSAQLAKVKIKYKTTFNIRINGVNDFSEYSRILSYLKSLSEVKTVEMLSLQQQKLELLIELKTGIDTFNQEIENGAVLAHDSLQTNTKIKQYQLMP